MLRRLLGAGKDTRRDLQGRFQTSAPRGMSGKRMYRSLVGNDGDGMLWMWEFPGGTEKCQWRWGYMWTHMVLLYLQEAVSQ